MKTETYEVASPSFRDMSLDEQIRVGVCDWVHVDASGREFFGRSKSDAERIARDWQAGLIS